VAQAKIIAEYPSRAGITSLKAQNGAQQLVGDVVLIPGTGISLSEDSQANTITIDGTPAGVQSLQCMTGSLYLKGNGILISTDPSGNLTLTLDGTKLVQSLNGLAGTVELVAGPNVAIEPLANGQLQISATAGSGGNGGTAGTGGAGIADRATFFAGFGSPLLAGSDCGTRHIAIMSSQPGALYAMLTRPAILNPVVFDVQSSLDGGSTWNSILSSPVTIPAGYTGLVTAPGFGVGSALAAGDLLRLFIISSDIGASGLIAAVRLDGATAPGWDRATFALGLSSNIQIGVDVGAYYIATQKTQPSTLYCYVKSPPSGGSTVIDIQVQHGGGPWTSIFSVPLTVPAGTTSVITTSTFNPAVTIYPGDLLRPMCLSGPASPGAGYILTLELEVTA
jgi:hypothetical protein